MERAYFMRLNFCNLAKNYIINVKKTNKMLQNVFSGVFNFVIFWKSWKTQNHDMQSAVNFNKMHITLYCLFLFQKNNYLEQ